MKEKIVCFRMCQNDYKKLCQKAQRANLNVSKYISEILMNKEVIILDNLKEFTFQLTKIGANLNQITKLVNAGTITCIDLEAVKRTEIQIWQSLNSLRNEVKKKKT